MKNLLKSKTGQGATEYILILGLIVAAVALFWPTITKALGNKATQIAGSLS